MRPSAESASGALDRCLRGEGSAEDRELLKRWLGGEAFAYLLERGASPELASRLRSEAVRHAINRLEALAPERDS